MGFTDKRVAENPELSALFEPVIRADLEMIEGLITRPRSRIPHPIIAVGASDDGDIANRELGSWASFTEGSFAQISVAGNHLFRGQESTLLRTVCDFWDSLMCSS